MTELVRLPPVLSLQLVRYEYDYKTMEKKKIKAVVSLPPTLDMGPRIGYVFFFCFHVFMFSCFHVVRCEISRIVCLFFVCVRSSDRFVSAAASWFPRPVANSVFFADIVDMYTPVYEIESFLCTNLVYVLPTLTSFSW